MNDQHYRLEREIKEARQKYGYSDMDGEWGWGLLAAIVFMIVVVLIVWGISIAL